MPQNPSTTKYDPYAALRYAEFRLFLFARFFMTIAFQMMAVIVGWQIYDLTKDPLALGMIGLVEAVPNISVALFAGHVADRYDRKKIILVFLSLTVISALMLAIYTTNDAKPLMQAYGTWPIYFIVFAIGLARGFLAPAIFAFLAQIVPRNMYANSATWSSNVWQTAAVTGPAVGGLIYGYWGITSAYIAGAASLILGISALNFVKSKPLPVSSTIKEPIGNSILSGLQFVFSRQIMLGALALDMFAVLFGGAVALLPIFSAEILKTGPEGLGLLRASPAAGAVLMALLMAYYPPLKHAGRNLLLAVAGFGLCMILFALSRNFYLSLALLAISGMLDNVSVVIRSTILQLLTPDNMRGRVSAVNNIFIGSSNELGALESGVAAKLLGVVNSVIFGGIMTILVVATTAKVAPKVRKLDLRSLQDSSES